ncbi:DUF6588 family protein [Flavobacterium sp.]|uniref:DUF6588 family protein n=1 Tax=Flavobacterium sp. TaxID=239 RepID=UPI002636CFF7|nr:DUF6588 family protein [Flavobacterium sp.]
MRKLGGYILAFFVTSVSATAQNTTITEIGNLIQDALLFTDRYITPATDAAVYQAASSWVNTPRNLERWDVNVGLHFNAFFVPNRDQTFTLNQSELKFFQISEGSQVITPTALGNDQYVTLTGTLNDEPVSMRTPEGVDRETIFYPYIQATLGLGFGTDFVVKIAPRTILKNVEYQVGGFGFKHTISRYFKNFEAKKIFLSAFVGYSREDISVEFLDVQTGFGNLGLTALNSDINTYQFQINGSKVWKKFELISALIVNRSDFEYSVSGKRGSIEDVFPLQSTVNTALETIKKTKTNLIGEISGRYQIKDFYVQSSIAFGKFVNSNISIQYHFH